MFALLELGRAQQALGQLEQAEESLRQARLLAESSVGRFHRHRPWIEHGLGRVLAARGRDAESRASLENAVRLSLERLDATGQGLPEAERHALTTGGRAILDAWLSSVLGSEEDPAVIADIVLRWHGRVLSGVHADRARIRDGASPDLGSIRTRLVQVLERLDATELVRSSRAVPSAATQALVAEREDLERQLLRALSSAPPEIVDGATVRARLAPDEALVQWFVWQRHEASNALHPAREERLLGIVLRRDQPTAVVDLGPLRPIEDAIRAYGTLVRRWTQPDPAAPALLARVGRITRDRVLGPLDAALAGVTRVIAIPDGILLDFPLGALPTADGAGFLLESWEIRYGTRALEAPLPPPRGNAALLVGAVEYGPFVRPTEDAAQVLAERLGLPLAALPSAAEEVHGASRALARRDAAAAITALTGAAATEAEVKAALERKRFDHFATHGEFLAEEERASLRRGVRTQLPTAVAGIRPALRCGIALARANGSATPRGFGEGILTASEIAWLDLTDCELVTISGCETGLGTPFPGEGLYGLRRSLRLAGVRNTVTAVFSVRDADVLPVMAELYAALADPGTSPSAAVHRAQRSYLAACRRAHGQALTGRWAAWIVESAP